MKKRLLGCGLLCAFIGVSFSLNAFCSFRLFKAPNGKLFLVIGDLHDREGTFQEHVESFMETLKAEKLSPPLEILTELPEKLPDEVAYELAPSFARIAALKKLTDTQKVSSFRFTSCDPREQISAELESLRKDLNRLVREVVTKEDYKKLLDADLPGSQTGKQWAEVKLRELAELNRSCKDPAVTRPDMTLKHYLASLSHILDRIEAIRNKYSDTKSIYALFENQYRSRYVAACKQVKESLESSLPAHDICYIFFKQHLSAITPIELFTKFIEFDAHVLESIDNLFATVEMLDHILSRSSSKDPLCMIVGETHAEEIAQSLKSLKWECLDEAALYKKVTPVHQLYPKVPYFKERFKKALTKILTPLKVPNPLEVSVLSCAACHASLEKVMKCSQCKKTVYCNVECQKKDWPSHKLNCQKVKVLVP